MKNKNFFYLLFFVGFLSFSQTSKSIAFYKSKFFEYQNIGTDSAMYYNNKVFASAKPIDLAFAYTAKWQLLSVTNQKYDEQEYVDKINGYLKKVPNEKQYYYELANIYNIQSQTYRINSNFSKALSKLDKAEKFALANGDIKQIIKIKSNISSVKGSLGMIDNAISEIKAILKLIDEHYNFSEKDYFEDWKNRNNLNIGTFYIEKYRITKQEPYIDSAKVIFKMMEKLNLTDYNRALVFSKLGILNNEIKQNDVANAYYRKSILLFSKLNMQKEITVNNYNLAYNLFQQKDYKSAKRSFKAIIENKKDTLIDFNLLFSYKYLANIYTAEKSDSAQYYLDKFLILYSKKTEAEKIELAKSYNEIEKKDLSKELSALKGENALYNKTQHFYLGTILLLVLFSCLSIYVFNQKRKNKEHKLNELLLSIKSIDEHEKTSIPIKINNENEKKIIEGLLKLEKDHYFLRKDFNLHNAAKKIGSNTTYLTSVIKTYKQMSFNDYTNELRINYILSELVKDKKLQNYTIQSLAEIVGYKNGASFSKIFKQKTGVTPFQFVEKLKAELVP